MSETTLDSSQDQYQEELVNVASPRKVRRGCCNRHPVGCGVTLLIVAAVACVVVGVSVGIRSYLEESFTNTVKQQLVLVPGTEGYDQFKSSSAPLYTKFYFFNVTNADEIRGGKHPVVKQVGPYTYRELRTKLNLELNQTRTGVSYDLNVTYVYEPSMSSGNPKTDKIITLNIPFYVLLLKLKDIEEDRKEDIKHLIEIAIEKLRQKSHEAGLFTELVVEDLLFGYNDPLLVELKKTINALPFNVAKEFAKSIDPFFSLENLTEVETGNEVHTGKDNITKVGVYREWSGHYKIWDKGGWGTPTAKMINGTGGFLFAPNVQREHNLTAFISELYRSGHFSYQEDDDLYGIKLYKYVLPQDELDSANQDPGFNANGPDGVLNMTAVFVDNAPVFASKPHFLDADPVYRRAIVGLDPNRSLHDSYLNVEPITGNVFQAAKRIQINLRLVKDPDFPEIKDIISPLMMPVTWGSEEGSLTKTLANEFKEKVYVTKDVIHYGPWAGFGLGVLVLVTMSLCFVGLVVQQYRVRRRRRHQSPAYDQQSLINN